MKQNLAIFDVDGTLYNGTLGIDFVKSLISEGIFSEEKGSEIFELFKKYKAGEMDKLTAVDLIYSLYGDGLKNHTKEEIGLVAGKTWDKVKKGTFSFSQEIVQKFKDKDFRVILLSGSPVEMLWLLGKNLGIEEGDILGGVIEIKEDIYTGKTISYPGNSEQKLETIDLFLKEKEINIDWDNSFAVGDDERDIGILNRVGNAFVLGSNPELLEEASVKGFTISNNENFMKDVLSQVL